MSRVVLSDAARFDRREITAYTVERFGLGQARRLRQQFEATLDNLAQSPLIGRTDEELDPPGRSLPTPPPTFSRPSFRRLRSRPPPR
ncbi:MAG: type II toxin-antitoxin system RelE/ParE family toxin, partial [Chloroflexi bacterium]|nr:type II toxin-antitoxin system RelE/ParE family toxin [Chloroflexota bacterium]